MNEDEEIYPPNIPEFIEQIKDELDKIENILKNNDSEVCCDIQMMLLLDIIVRVIYNINSALSFCYGDDEK